jgi:hypothetical protein|tara:strand:- start:936 stop:1049 length:114 start_codon:yes stop_codon:yes gene_type:complete
MIKYIEEIKTKVKDFCMEYPLTVAFGVGFILGGLIIA